MILHKVSSSPNDNQSLLHCLMFMAKDDGLLLMQDGVYAMTSSKWSTVLLQQPKIYVLQEDIIARGLRKGNANFTFITYEQFVDLSLKFDSVMSW